MTQSGKQAIMTDNINESDIYSLIFAVRDGRLKQVMELIDAYSLSYAKEWSEGYVLLCDALKYKHAEIAKFLLTKGARVVLDIIRSEQTPLHYAVINNYIEIAEIILRRGPNINAKAIDGFTPLHIAVQNGNKQLVKLLLQFGADVDSKDELNITPLHLAVKKGFMEIVEIILDTGVHFNSRKADGFTPLRIAVKNSHKKLALLKFGADVNSRDKTADNSTPLHIAVKKGHKELVILLLKYSADVNSKDERNNTPLHIAVQKNFTDIAEIILAKGVDIDAKIADSCTALQIAIQNGSKKMVKLLLEFGADVDFKDESDITCLREAALKGFTEIVEIILAKVASTNAKKPNSFTPLHIPIKDGYMELVELLLELGVCIDSKNKSGITPLQLAAHYDRKTVEVILNFGADINSKDVKDRTALYYATEKRLLKFYFPRLRISSNNIKLKHALEQALDGVVDFSHIGNIHYRNRFQDNHFLHRRFDDNSPDNRCIVNEKVDVLCRHLVKMKAANFVICRENLQLLLYHLHIFQCRINFKEFHRKCKVEIQRLKWERIHITSEVSYYDILVKDTRSLVRYIRNENILQVLEAGEYKTKFKIYASMIENSFRKSMERMRLVNMICAALAPSSRQYSYTQFVGEAECVQQDNDIFILPEPCTENILSYLSDQELKIFSEVPTSLIKRKRMEENLIIKSAYFLTLFNCSHSKIHNT